MPKLVWDNVGERFYETGIDHGVLFVQNANGTYKTGVPWNGLTAVTESPSGADANPIYADNIKYVELRSAEEFGATVEAYTYPDEFAECDGSVAIADGVFLGQQRRNPFGLAYRTRMGNDTQYDDYGYKLHIIYNATASPSEKGYQTVNDSPEAISFSWELTTVKVAVEGHRPVAQITIDSTKADPTKLAQLETLLFGGEGENDTSQLPTPAEVLALFGAGAVSVRLNKSILELADGDTETLEATTTPDSATVTWSSGNTAVATVTSGGVVTAVDPGMATIMASITENGVTARAICTVIVSDTQGEG